MLTVGSLFAGIGGFDLGLERAGMQVKWQVEIDSYCLKVLEKHWPHVRRYTDIKQVDWSTVEPVDLVCGGFPCQPVSVAGKRKGTADERWLWPEFVRCFSVLRPRYIVIENVPGLLTANDGLAFAEVLRDVAACGYDAEWDCIPASAVGAPHWRDRCWAVAYTKSFDARLFREEGRSSLQPGNIPWREWVHRQTESPICRSDDELPERAYAIKALGNSIYPGVVEWIGRQIIRADAEYRT